MKVRGISDWQLKQFRVSGLECRVPLRQTRNPETETRNRGYPRLAMTKPIVRSARSYLLAVSLVLLVSGCSREPEQLSQDPSWNRGRAVYIANCVACHNSDPSKDGPIGPAIAGSSQELLEYRVLRIEYPPGYTPKRDTRMMPTFPFLKEEIPYLAAYLADGATPPLNATSVSRKASNTPRQE